MEEEKNKKISFHKMLDEVDVPMMTQPILSHHLMNFRYHFITTGPFPVIDRLNNNISNDPTCLWYRNYQR